jgi:23S rRNA (cytidine1920-2'-O)/16S rRNA (cytidine1409-2'-O)-methyltransferase
VPRLDQLLVERGLYRTRSRARDAVLRGGVKVDGRTAAKPAQTVPPHADIEIADAAQPYVSRAALKLAHGLDHFDISATGLAALDLGASTGGFTQMLLERGATHVTALDVGHGQMAPGLEADPRVTLLEDLNARDLAATHLAEAPGIITADLSFISLKLALPPALALAAPGAWLVALIKPQFEAGPAHISKSGLVRDAAMQEAVCRDIAHWLETAMAWHVVGTTPSPIAGGDGNREFLIAARKIHACHPPASRRRDRGNQ